MKPGSIVPTAVALLLTLSIVGLTSAPHVTAGPVAAPTPGGGLTYSTPTPPVLDPAGVLVLTRTYTDLALSQDGNDLYLTDYYGSTFERYAVSSGGSLTLAKSWSNSGGFSGQPQAIIVGPSDTVHVAVTQLATAGLAAFGPSGPRLTLSHVSTLWNTTSWWVSPRQTVVNSAMLSADYSAISPDGRFAYVAPYQNAHLIVYARSAVGDMTAQPPVQTLDLNPPTGDPRSVIISPDGAHIYMGWSAPWNLLAFSRNAQTGQVGLIQTLQFAANTSANLHDLVISPDGKYVYALGYRHVGSATRDLKTYARDPVTGMLAFVATRVVSGGGTGEVESTHNGRYVLHFAENTLTVYRRNALTGALTQVQAVTVSGLTGQSQHLAVSADDTFVLVGRGGSILRLALNAYCPTSEVASCP